MPTYEYECKSCAHTFEAFQSMSEPPLTSCPECGKEVRRLINGGTGIIFKGSGFYVTDKSGGGKRSSASSSPSVSKESSDSSKPVSSGETSPKEVKSESSGEKAAV